MKKKRGTIVVRPVDKGSPLSEHHRKPSSLGGGGGEYNIQMITEIKHRAWHSLFENMTPEEIASEINRYYLDLDYLMVAHHV